MLDLALLEASSKYLLSTKSSELVLVITKTPTETFKPVMYSIFRGFVTNKALIPDFFIDLRRFLILKFIIGTGGKKGLFMLSWNEMNTANKVKNGLRRVVSRVTLVLASILPFLAHAQVYSGGGLSQGISDASGLGGISNISSISEIIIKIILFILDIALLLAVAVVIIAGIYLITSNGDEGQRDKAKKIIYYAIIGIIVILLSRVIVVFVNSLF